MKRTDYTAIEDVVSALLLGPDDLMLIVKPDPPRLYCDRSGQPPYTAVAGAIATVSKWRSFDEQWTRALKDEGLEYFHMSDFAQSVGQFAVGWKNNEKRRRAFLLRLAKIMVDHIA